MLEKCDIRLDLDLIKKKIFFCVYPHSGFHFLRPCSVRSDCGQELFQLINTSTNKLIISTRVVAIEPFWSK
jgi:hypothetical protein